MESDCFILDSSGLLKPVRKLLLFSRTNTILGGIKEVDQDSNLGRT